MRIDDAVPGRVIRDRTLSRSEVESLAGTPPRHLIDCVLEDADLSGLDLASWKFERCNLRRSGFAGARLEGTAWESCRGAFANFTGADLCDASFAASDLNNSSFKRATLTSARFIGCKLTGADLSDAKANDIHVSETLLVNARLARLCFRKEVLQRVDFSQADVRGCDFRQAVFEECSLREANMQGARFEGADLRAVDLGGLKLADASLFRGATISREQAGQILGELGINVR